MIIVCHVNVLNQINWALFDVYVSKNKLVICLFPDVAIFGPTPRGIPRKLNCDVTKQHPKSTVLMFSAWGKSSFHSWLAHSARGLKVYTSFNHNLQGIKFAFYMIKDIDYLVRSFVFGVALSRLFWEVCQRCVSFLWKHLFQPLNYTSAFFVVMPVHDDISKKSP